MQPRGANVPFDHIAIDYSQLYRPVLRIATIDQSERPILIYPIDDGVNQVPPPRGTNNAILLYLQEWNVMYKNL